LRFRPQAGRKEGKLKLKRFLFACFLLPVLSLGLMAPDAGAQAVQGVTDTEILVGQWGPQTGSAALWGAVARGSGLLFKGVNDEGGIYGRKIKYFLRDDAYQPAKTKAIGKEFVEQIGVFAVVGGVGMAGGMANRDYFAENKVVWVGPATGVYNWIQPFQKYLFPVYPLYDDEAYALTQLFCEKLNFRKIAVFYQNDDYGKAGLSGVERYLQEKKIDVPVKVSAEVTDRDLSTHALKLKNSGAEAVIMWAMPKHGALILAETAKIGYRPQWGTNNALSDAPMMMQLTKGLWAGMIHSNFAEVPDSNHPLMAKYRAWHQKYEPEERWGVFYYAGMLLAEPLVEGLKRAGKNLTEESFMNAMESLKDWQGIGPPVTFTPTDHQGGKHVFFGKVEPNGTIRKLTDWVKITE